MPPFSFDALVMVHPDATPPLNPQYRASIERYVMEVQGSGKPIFVLERANIEGMVQKREITDYLIEQGAAGIPRLARPFEQAAFMASVIGKPASEIEVAIGGTFAAGCVYESGMKWCAELSTNHVGDFYVPRPSPLHQLARGVVLDGLV